MTTNLLNPGVSRPQAITARRSRRIKGGVLILFLLGVILRLDELGAPGHLIDREYMSAIFARSILFDGDSSVEGWQRDIARVTRDRQPVLEPPVTEYLVSLIYRVIGREDLRYAHVLTSLFWLVGGIFLYQIARDMLSSYEALFATAYYLLVPMGIIISRSFQPDALMMMLFLISLFCIWRYFRERGLRWLLLSAFLTGLTLLVRPLVTFALAGGFFALFLYSNRQGKRVSATHFLLFGAISAALPLVYYGYGIWVTGLLRWKIDDSFRPFLFGRREFWMGWASLAINVIGIGPLVAALLGFPLVRSGPGRALLLGMSVGYLPFGLAFTYHIHTHPYYQIQLFPVVGICAAPVALLVVQKVSQLSPRLRWIFMLPTLLLVVYWSQREVMATLYKPVFESSGIAREVGNLVKHSPRTVYVAHYYGMPLQYYGELTGSAWPVKIEDPLYQRAGDRERTVEERIAALNFTPEYFVITYFEEARSRHADLLQYLPAHCTILAEANEYVIYHACSDPMAQQQ